MGILQMLFTLLVVINVVLLVNAQLGPYPPRLNIPGAVPVPTRAPQRNDRVVRVRRPIGLRSQPAAVTPRILDEAKPVTESAEEDEAPDAFLPQLLREQQLSQAQQQQFHHTAASFFGNEPNAIPDTPIANQPSLYELAHPSIGTLPTRFPERSSTISTTISHLPPNFNDFGIGSGISGIQRYGIDRSQSPSRAPAVEPVQHTPPPPPPSPPQRTNVIRSRPQVLREPRPQYEVPVQAAVPAPRPRPKPIQSRPVIDQNQLQDERDTQTLRRQKPVAQTIRKWREENEDGSITWGYENDDGSFKEEIIGTDCVTKGTYGYIDPDGNKREYHYETGIKCDPNTRQTEDELQENGFVNYEENKAVLPNGIEIDMTQIGKKKSKRPSANFRN